MDSLFFSETTECSRDYGFIVFSFVAMECGYMASSEKSSAYAEGLLHLKMSHSCILSARPHLHMVI